MQTSLQGLANKARSLKKYRFLNLYTRLNEEWLLTCWGYLNKKAASGIDAVSAKEYERNLKVNIAELVDSLKEKRYRANLVKRKYIPKGKDEKRPLGIIAIADKLLQMAVAIIIQIIYEQEFLPSCFGYRKYRGAKEAVKELTTKLYGRYHYVVEADIRDFFGSINHEWMIRMLEERISDRALMRLIQKWLKAGVMEEDGSIIQPETGTPQGGVISPVLANIYLHYVLDLWFEKVVKKSCKGEAYLCRYADDFVCLFQNKEDAERFYNGLAERLKKFGLEVAIEKTRVISFSRYGNGGEEGFDFLGFEFRWGESRRGKRIIKRRTSRKKLRKAIANITEWIKKARCKRIKRIFYELNDKLRGYYNYYGVIGNYDSLNQYYYQVIRLLKKWLNRRSQRQSVNWGDFKELLQRYRIEKPRITEKLNRQLVLFKA